MRNRELGLIALALLIATAGFAAVQLARAQEFASSPLIAAAFFAGAYLVAHLVVRATLPDADPYVLPITAVLTAIGLIEIYRIDATLARDQGIWIVIGLVLFIGVIIAFRDIRRLETLRYTCGALAVVLLLATITLGAQVNGARLWIRIGGLQIQPGEFAKILLVIFLAGYLRERREVLAAPTRKVLGVGVPSLRHSLPLLIIAGAGSAVSSASAVTAHTGSCWRQWLLPLVPGAEDPGGRAPGLALLHHAPTLAAPFPRRDGCGSRVGRSQHWVGGMSRPVGHSLPEAPASTQRYGPGRTTTSRR